jgi:acyl-CoA synthetase (AMP-forming)/AMP-acid ligase II
MTTLLNPAAPVLRTWLNPGMVRDAPATLADVIDRGSRLFGDRLAVVDDGVALSYVALRARVHAMASQLRAEGVRPGDVVAVEGRNRVWWVVAAFGALMCGAVVAPLSHDHSSAERAAKLDGLAPVLVLTEDWTSSGAQSNSPPMYSGPRADDVALLLATSGTTGSPDYVPMTHGQLVRLYGEVSRRLGLTSDDRIFGAVPLAHSFGFNGVLLAGLLAGSRVRLLPAYDRHRVAALVRDERLSVVAGPPTVFHDLAQAVVPLGDSCRMAITGSAVVSARPLRETCDGLGIADVIVGYGLTEAAGTVSIGVLQRDVDQVWMTPLSGIAVRIVDETGTELHAGEPGRILVRGYNVCRRSLRGPARDPAHWLDTGDLGRLDAGGRLVVESRRDDMVVVSGFNVYPQEVEAVLLKHPAVAAAAVIGLPDPRQGQQVVAGVVASDGQRPSEAELIAHCRRSMAPYKVPRRVVALAQLPLTSTGKVSRTALRRRLEGDASV